MGSSPRLLLVNKGAERVQPGFLHCRRLDRRTSPALGQRVGIWGLSGTSVAGGSRTPHFSWVGRQPGFMVHSKTYNSLVLLLMSQDGAVLQSNPQLINMTACAQTLQNLNTVQYIRWNIKREGLCEIYNVRPLAILGEEGSPQRKSHKMQPCN